MIAAGLGLMGGCFAQDDNGMAVDTYWPAISAAIPYSQSSIAILQYDVVPAGAQPDDFFARIMQVLNSGVASFFYVFQSENTAYNCYAFSDSKRIEIVSNADMTPAVATVSPPIFVNLHIDADGARLPDFNLAVPACKWDSASPGENLRIIDARAGEKEFFHSYGKWGRKWFVLPLRSALNTAAVFDFESKVLVEL